jgi:hypothetical protein
MCLFVILFPFFFFFFYCTQLLDCSLFGVFFLILISSSIFNFFFFKFFVFHEKGIKLDYRFFLSPSLLIFLLFFGFLRLIIFNGLC